MLFFTNFFKMFTGGSGQQVHWVCIISQGFPWVGGKALTGGGNPGKRDVSQEKAFITFPWAKRFPGERRKNPGPCSNLSRIGLPWLSGPFWNIGERLVPSRFGITRG